MATEPMNELTFVARLSTFTALRAERRRGAGEDVLIATGNIEEKQIDSLGRVRRCDMRLSTASGRKLASGEMKRPEVADGRDPRNERLVKDARAKAVARGLPFYFTCNMAEVVLFAVAARPGEPDREEISFQLAAMSHSREVEASLPDIEANWIRFLDDLERRLVAVIRTRPSVTNADVIALRDAIYTVADEALDRVVRRVSTDRTLADSVREDAASVFSFPAALKTTFRPQFTDELRQILRFGVFVVAQKLVLYRVLEETGPRRAIPFSLDRLVVERTSTDPAAVRGVLDSAFGHAIKRSGDFETAFLPQPLANLVFLEPATQAEAADCRIGAVWYQLLEAVRAVSWVSISQNLIGFLYEVIVDPQFRHELGQFYTREDVVDLLTTFAVRSASDTVLDPSAGGGSFLRAAYIRKRNLGDTHQDALAHLWGCEITAFAAELSTITLATSDTSEPAAYPRILLKDFFDVRPGIRTELEVPGVSGRLRVPKIFDAVIGNPPYISYRRITNQPKIINALATLPRSIALPKFSGKSDAYVWFIVHATQFLANSGRLAFVVSSAILFADYGVPLVRFIGRHYRIHAVIDSMVERWFPDADTNTVLLFLERCTDEEARLNTEMRFVRFRRPLARLLPAPDDDERRQGVEDLVDQLMSVDEGDADPRWLVSKVIQGADAGLRFGVEESGDSVDLLEGDGDEE